MKTLTFQNTTLTPVKTDNQIWLSSADLAKALGYSQSRAVSKLYNENQDEFTPSMTALIPNPHMKNANIRIFSLKGCHLIAMFSRTTIAKEFRKWVLDILDKEVGAPVQRHTISVEQQAQIRHAIAKRCKSNREHYQSVYTALHQEFNIPRYNELLAVDFERAMAFIQSYQFGNADLYNVLADSAVHTLDYMRLLKSLKGLPIIDEQLAHNTFMSLSDSLKDMANLAAQLDLRNRHGKPMFEQGKINYFSGSTLIYR